MKQELTGLLNAPVVFAHNDLLSGNIMVNDEEGIFDHSFWVILFFPSSIEQIRSIFYFCYHVVLLLLVCFYYNIYVPILWYAFKCSLSLSLSLSHTCMLTCWDTKNLTPSSINDSKSQSCSGFYRIIWWFPKW